MTPLILAIDTSCDDTSAAVTQGVTVLSNIIASQTQLHTPYGGVFPTVAKQAHRENIDRVITMALRRARVKPQQLAAVAVTQGPGLAPALEVGIKRAKELAQEWQLPLIPVNHIEAHAISALAQPLKKQRAMTTAPKYRFPVLSLVVSGGHTEFFLIKELGGYERLGGTIDDAAGEALDKVGRMLGLGYPAGPVIEQLARRGDPKRLAFPLPMTMQHHYDLSFSGLKTFARNLSEKLERDGQLHQQGICHFAASFQYAVFRHINHKLNKILLDRVDQGDDPISEVWLGGGVAANMALRQSLRQTLRQWSQRSSHPKPVLRVPYSKRLTMDNAAMIGVVANLHLQRGTYPNDPKLIERRPRWAVGENGG